MGQVGLWCAEIAVCGVGKSGRYDIDVMLLEILEKPSGANGFYRETRPQPKTPTALIEGGVVKRGVFFIVGGMFVSN